MTTLSLIRQCTAGNPCQDPESVPQHMQHTVAQETLGGPAERGLESDTAPTHEADQDRVATAYPLDCQFPVQNRFLEWSVSICADLCEHV